MTDQNISRFIFKILYGPSLWIVTVFLACNFSCCSLYAQNQLEIHHLNIGNGDATIVALVEGGNITAKVIIDGGNSNSRRYLLPYINQELNNTHFNLVILSHYHRDHYNGLLALKRGQITADSVIDAGGYSLNLMGNALDPNNTGFPPFPPPNAWKTNLHQYWLNFNNNFERITEFNDIPNQISDSIIIGAISGIDVVLVNVAGAGFNIENNNIQRSIVAGRNNANNFSLGWIINWGEFRYYTAGDIGGYSANYNYNGQQQHCSSYVDQESGIAEGLQDLVQYATPFGNQNVMYDGHICAFKTSHHGSACSNNSALLDTMRAAVSITSAGSNRRWKLPKPASIYRISQYVPITNWGNNAQNGVFTKGVYFTNLQNFNGQNSLTIANNFFNGNNTISYHYGATGAYIITVPDIHPLTGDSIQYQSTFNVSSVNIGNGQARVTRGWFECHE